MPKMFRVVREMRDKKRCSSCCTDENHDWTEEVYGVPTDELHRAERDENKAWDAPSTESEVRDVRIEEAHIDWKVK